MRGRLRLNFWKQDVDQTQDGLLEFSAFSPFRIRILYKGIEALYWYGT